jgi:hypothetical protein
MQLLGNVHESFLSAAHKDHEHALNDTETAYVVWR